MKEIKLFDSHTHINNEGYSEDERLALIEEIENSEVGYIVDNAFDIASGEIAAENAGKYPWYFATIGVHPHNAEEMTEKTLSDIKRIAGQKGVVAIGEIGLDFFRNISPKDVQRAWFRRQIRLANEMAMPITIHSRDADKEVMDILIEEGAFSKARRKLFSDGSPHVLLHCFSGSKELALQYVDLGGMISIAGPVTYKNNLKTPEVVKALPLEKLLIETDAPYLTPEPFRGKQNKSPYVKYVAEKIAEIKRVSYEEVVEATTKNAKDFFIIDEE
ncbi:MAG: TatD family hydrolase [Anaerovoracaceae bacterium]